MTSPRIFDTPHALIGQEGQQLGPTDWLEIDQARVDGFAAVTGDHQWIHVDVDRAREGPFGGTIAHGYLTMSLVNAFLPDLIEVRGFAHAVNVGLDRLRFLAPVKVGSRIRAVVIDVIDTMEFNTDGKVSRMLAYFGPSNMADAPTESQTHA